jgi:hypothetical protein
MRSLLLVAVAVLAGCSTPAEQAQNQARYEARSEAKLQQYLAGKVQGKAQECLTSFRSQDMIRIDDDTVLFRDGGRRFYRNELNGSCNGLGNSHYAMVTRTVGGAGRLCRGDIARMVDVGSGTLVGSCVIGEFVPYTSPRG